MRLAGLFIGVLALGTCHAEDRPNSVAQAAASNESGRANASLGTKETKMLMTAGGRRFEIEMADTAAARAFVARLPMTLDMTDLNDNEKKFDLPKSLPANPARPGTIRVGDVMLWRDNTVVVFYKTFESSYTYTRLARVIDATGLVQALGAGSVQVQFSVQP